MVIVTVAPFGTRKNNMEILKTDIRWEMDWSQVDDNGNRIYPDKPLKETIFNDRDALAMLLAEEVVFLNNHWWKSDSKYTEELWPDEAAKTFSISVNCSDIFYWASADAEEMMYEDLESVYDHWDKDPHWGPAVWCIKKRNLMPQAAVYLMIKEQGIWDLDSMGLDSNSFNLIK